MSGEAVIGWDIGGTHLKAARLGPDDAVERVVQLPVPLWQGLSHLSTALDQAMLALHPAARHAVTMTGEMVDLFPNREAGVRELVRAMRERLPEADLRIFAGLRGFLAPDEAILASPAVASANWLATASFVATRLESAIVVDIGSTTADLVPVARRRVQAEGTDDRSRMVLGELVYTGVVRTPLMALADRVPWKGELVPLMAEHFATSADIYRLTGQLPDGADQHPAADGGEKTVEASARRLARMLGCDWEAGSLAEWRRLAAWFREEQLRRIEDALALVCSRAELSEEAPIIGAGVGRFLARQLAARRGKRYVDFADLLPPSAHVAEHVADCAPAVAVAWLAARLGV